MNFADHPESVGELRSNRDCDAAKWKPRDVLVSLLRDIDSGKADIDALIVCYRQHVDEKARGRFLQSTPDGLVTLGLLSATAHQIMAGD